MSETATRLISNSSGLGSSCYGSENAQWKEGVIVDEFLLLDYESGAVGLREMRLTTDDVQRLRDVLAQPSRSTIVPCDLPLV